MLDSEPERGLCLFCSRLRECYGLSLPAQIRPATSLPTRTVTDDVTDQKLASSRSFSFCCRMLKVLRNIYHTYAQSMRQGLRNVSWGFSAHACQECQDSPNKQSDTFRINFIHATTLCLLRGIFGTRLITKTEHQPIGTLHSFVAH